MEEIYFLINQKKADFSQHPFFDFLRDTTISPIQRLAWIPCAAPLIMGFADLNRFVFYDGNLKHPIQKLINIQAEEEGEHWIWFLEDMKTLGFNKYQNLVESINFLWSNQTIKSRQLCSRVSQYIYNADPVIKLVAVETMEATWHVALPITMLISQEIKEKQQKNLHFFGNSHYDAEMNHTIDSNQAVDVIKSMNLSERQRQKAVEIVENIFDDFYDCVDEFLAFACNYKDEVYNEQTD